MSVEADLTFFDGEGGTRKSDEVDGQIGELSPFHQTYSYYAQGVDLSTAKLPDGWEQRLVPFEPPSAEPARARCLEKHDMGLLKDRAAALTSVSPVVRTGA